MGGILPILLSTHAVSLTLPKLKMLKNFEGIRCSDVVEFIFGSCGSNVMYKIQIQIRDFRSFGMLRSSDLLLYTNVSGQAIGTVFKGQLVTLHLTVRSKRR